MSHEDVEIQRPTLGEKTFAFLGDLFDARSDAFLTGVSLFNSAPEIQWIDTDHTRLKVIKSESYRRKFEKLGIGAELAASLLSGLVQLDIDGSYLSTTDSTDQTAEASLIYCKETRYERVELNSPKTRDSMAFKTIKDNTATHFVSAISWGARCTLTAKRTLSNSEDLLEASASISAKLKKFKIGPKGGAGAQGKGGRENIKASESLEITVFGDVISDKLMPSDLEKAFAYMEEVPKYMSQCNGGKGKPQVYTLAPLSRLKTLQILEIDADITLFQLKQECLDAFVKLFDEVRETGREIGGYYRRLKAHSACIPPSHIAKISSVLDIIDNYTTSLKSEYSVALKSTRSGKLDAEELWKIHGRFIEKQSEIKRRTPNMSYQHKMQFMGSIQSKGATYCGFGSSTAQDIIYDSLDKHEDAYLFVFPEESRGTRVWRRALHLFEDLIADAGKDGLFIVVDSEAYPQQDVSAPQIQLWRNGTLIQDDLFERHESSISKCVMRYDEAHLKRLKKRSPRYRDSKRRVVIKVECPNKYCDPTNRCRWFCYKCEACLEYEKDTELIHCDCGSAPYVQWTARCNDPRHGRSWCRHTSKNFKISLDSIEPQEDLNVLILGPERAGKSTFINAFANYLLYPSLEAAIHADDFKCPIPSSFSSDPADTQPKPKSSSAPKQAFQNATTKESHAYSFILGDTLIRLIDTPGVNKIRSPEKEEEWAMSILSSISPIGKLHGVLILLDSRSKYADLEPTIIKIFGFLEQHIGDITPNIIFGFTGAGDTYNTSGPMFWSLKELLKRHTSIGIIRPSDIYHFDSKGFLYLAANLNKKGFNIDPTDKSRLCWQKSLDQCKKMLSHLGTRVPYKVSTQGGLRMKSQAMKFVATQLVDIMLYLNEIVSFKKSLYERDTKMLGILEQLEDNPELLKNSAFSVILRNLGYDLRLCERSTDILEQVRSIRQKILTRGNVDLEVLENAIDSKVTILQAAARFSVFLRHNSPITPKWEDPCTEVFRLRMREAAATKLEDRSKTSDPGYSKVFEKLDPPSLSYTPKLETLIDINDLLANARMEYRQQVDSFTRKIEHGHPVPKIQDINSELLYVSQIYKRLSDRFTDLDLIGGSYFEEYTTSGSPSETIFTYHAGSHWNAW